MEQGQQSPETNSQTTQIELGEQKDDREAKKLSVASLSDESEGAANDTTNFIESGETVVVSTIGLYSLCIVDMRLALCCLCSCVI